MSVITKKVVEVLKKESDKKAKLKPIFDLRNKLVEKGAVPKSNYSIPLKDTIGRTYTFNTNGK